MTSTNDDAAAAKAVSDASDQKFPAVDAKKELNPELNKTVQVDPVSSDVANSTETKKKQIEAPEKEKGDQKDGMQTLKTTVIISGVAVAVAGAIFALTRKLREKQH